MNQQQKFLTAIILTFCGLLFFKSYVLAGTERHQVAINYIGDVIAQKVTIQGTVTKTEVYPTLAFTLIDPEIDVEYLLDVETVVWSTGTEHNYWTATVDVHGIPQGSYNLQVVAQFAGGPSATDISVVKDDSGGRCNGGVCVP